MKTLIKTMAALKTVELNADSEYASSFGISCGDMLFLGPCCEVEDGDLVVVEVNGGHQLDTYDADYENLDGAIGVLVGCLKVFKGKEVPHIDDYEGMWPDLLL